MRSVIPWIVAASLAAIACEQIPAVDPAIAAAHRVEIQAWRTERDTRLRNPTGWLSLAGLSWIGPGANTIGSSADSVVRLPASAPENLGVITLVDGKASLKTTVGHKVEVDGKAVTSVALVSDEKGAPTRVTVGAVHFYAIARSGKLAIRVKDENSPVLASFTGMDYFDIDVRWRMTGKLQRHPTPTKIPVPSALGGETQEASPGRIVFEHNGATQSLLAVGEADDDELFVIFGDATNKAETYGAGRFVYATIASDDTVVLDLNKAYNPPCIFTPYATCSLPPKGNRLAFEARAGEKVWGHH